MTAPNWKHPRRAQVRNRAATPWTVEMLLAKSVSEGDCQVMNKSHTAKYPMVAVGNSRQKRAHRVMYELVYGEIPPGAVIHHKCGNRYCIKADHLQLASNAENSLEMMARRTYEARIAFLEARVAELEGRST